MNRRYLPEPDEPPATVRFSCRRQVRARKPHRCQVCGRTIKPGESYIREASMTSEHDRPEVFVSHYGSLGGCEVY